jgi:hypothetical protein
VDFLTFTKSVSVLLDATVKSLKIGDISTDLHLNEHKRDHLKKIALC